MPPLSAIATQTEPPSKGEMSTSHETQKRRISSSSDDETKDDDDVRVFYEIASPYLKNMRLLDEQSGIRKDGNTFMRVILMSSRMRRVISQYEGSHSGLQRYYGRY